MGGWDLWTCLRAGDGDGVTDQKDADIVVIRFTSGSLRSTKANMPYSPGGTSSTSCSHIRYLEYLTELGTGVKLAVGNGTLIATSKPVESFTRPGRLSLRDMISVRTGGRPIHYLLRDLTMIAHPILSSVAGFIMVSLSGSSAWAQVVRVYSPPVVAPVPVVVPTAVAKPVVVNRVALPVAAPVTSFSVPVAAPVTSFSVPVAAPVTSFSVPAAAPVTSFSVPVAAPVTSFSVPVAAPVTSFSVPVAAPVTSFSVPAAAPVTSFSVPAAAPVTSFSVPVAAPVTSYSVPVAAPVVAQPVIVRPKVYVPGQPIRNVLRAITP